MRQQKVSGVAVYLCHSLYITWFSEGRICFPQQNLPPPSDPTWSNLCVSDGGDFDLCRHLSI
jgi:hypothetical protein